MALTDQLLKYKIVADAYQAKAEIKSTDDAFKQLGGSAASSMGSLAAPAGIAAGAVAGIGAAAIASVAGFVKLSEATFDLTKQASELGSRFFDFQEKTGLAAETISALDIAAKQSGTTLESVSTSTGKFSKLIGQANDGSKEAQKTLQTLGVTSGDLNTALTEVFETIAKAKPGVEQITLAQKAFGKAGADMIPLIKQMSGDLAGFTENAEKLGLTLTNADLKAADDFGDTLDQLHGQVEVISAAFALQFAPVITAAMQEVSQVFANNKDTIREWGKEVGSILTYVVDEVKQLTLDTYELGPAFVKAGEQVNAGFIVPVARGTEILQKFISLVKSIIPGRVREGRGGSGSVSVEAKTALEGGAGVEGYIDTSDISAGGRGGRGGGGGGAANTAKQQERERLEALKAAASQEIKAREDTDKAVLASYQLAVAQGTMTDAEELQKRQDLEESFFDVKAEALNKELALVQNNAKEKARIENEIVLVGLAKELKQIQDLIEVEKFRASEQKKADDQKKRAQDVELARLAAIGKKLYENAEKAKEDAAKQLAAYRALIESQSPTAPGTLLGSLQESLGATIPSAFDPATNAMKSFQVQLADVQADINNFTGVGLGNMIDGLAQMGAAWLSSGEFSAKAALQMISATALQIAFTAIMKEVFEYAEAAAAFARWDFASGTAHLAAAGMYQIAATVAGGIGIGAGLGARAMGGGKKGGGASSRGGSPTNSSSSSSQPLQPYSRSDPSTFISGSRNSDAHVAALAVAVDKLQQKINSMPAGDIVTIGVKQRPGLVTQTHIAEIGRNSSYSKQIMQRMRIK